MESFRQALGAIYIALADAAGGPEVLQRANEAITDALDCGCIPDAYARTMLEILVKNSK